MLRESGVEHRRLQQVWPRYDAMRTELALGQFADLASDVRDLPSMAAVLETARRKSGNYTVRRPLEIGAAMSGCSDRTISGLGRYGEAVGEAFQLRDDVLGVFGAETVSGKPEGQDLIERKASSVVIAAHQLADPSGRRQLTDLMNSRRTRLRRHRPMAKVDRQDRRRAVDRRQDRPARRVGARESSTSLEIDERVRAALTNMAVGVHGACRMMLSHRGVVR